MLRFISLYLDVFPLDLHLVQALEVMQQEKVTFVTPEAKAIEALNLCLRSKYSGVGIVDPNTNKLIGNISVSDLRVRNLFLFSYFQLLHSPLLMLRE